MASFYNHYYRYYRPYPFRQDKISSEEPSPEPKEKSSRSYSFGPIHFKTPIFQGLEDPIFEIFGIQLYLDDMIILGLLFFLYQEGVQDEMLYIALILLLLG